MKIRHRVLVLLSLLSVIMYLDRVCISVAGPRMQEALGLDPSQWGWVTGAFTLAYALFEIPSGGLGDRIGARKVLTRIVLWWSAFTSITGMVSSFVPLVITRFLFGMGEAGAAPNIGVAIGRWFPLRERTRAWGAVLMAAQVGGAMAPFLVVPIQQAYGWRASFWVFGGIGIVWAVVCWRWFRDTPAQMAQVKPEELAEIGAGTQRGHAALPWGIALRSVSLWAVILMAGCVGYGLVFFQTWLGTYLVRARGFTETGLLLASLPFLVGAVANTTGGVVGDRLVHGLGLKQGRRVMFVLGYGGAAVFLALGALLPEKYSALAALSLAYGGMTLAQPALMSVCLDLGGKYGGAVTGAMNSAAYGAGFLSSVVYGYIATGYGYTMPFAPMVALMTIGTLASFWIDAGKEVVPKD